MTNTPTEPDTRSAHASPADGGERLQLGRRSATLERVTIRRMDHVGIVFNDLASAKAFFVALGLNLQVEGGWVDRVWGSRVSGQSSQ